jgi:hypothetical protein
MVSSENDVVSIVRYHLRLVDTRRAALTMAGISIREPLFRNVYTLTPFSSGYVDLPTPAGIGISALL